MYHNTGADTERSGTGWDEIYYSEMQTLNPSLEGKKVAVFGLGDSVSYSENYADATGEVSRYLLHFVAFSPTYSRVSH
jgi:flavodoxin I